MPTHTSHFRLFPALALCIAAAAAEGWQPLFENEQWYRQQPGKEIVFRGKLEAVKGAGGPSTLMRTSYYRLGDRTIYTGAKRVGALGALVGKEVELRGKAVDLELEGQSLREIWPAAARIAVPGADGLERVVLRDVQGLWGGRDLWLRGDGRLIVNVVDPRKGDKAVSQYGLQLPGDQVAATAKLVAERHFLKIEIPNRPGVPDEARPTITVRLTDGTEKTVAKWANDKHADFDALYKHLLALCTLAQKNGKLLFEGPRGSAPKLPEDTIPVPKPK
ncbi:MAG TPA: hypothetical protein VNE39_08175 [Planctomycetota bacterium]|nr:hypothetical protein [Planctomycetota bacterium]